MGGQECLFTQRGGNRTQVLVSLPLSPSAQQFASILTFPRTSKNTCNLHLLIHGHINHKRKAISVQNCVCAGAFICMYTHHSAIDHGYIKIARTAGLNPRLGNELQLQWMKSNYTTCLPVDGPCSFFSCTGTHLQPYIIAFDLCNRQRHTAGPHFSG